MANLPISETYPLLWILQLQDTDNDMATFWRNVGNAKLYYTGLLLRQSMLDSTDQLRRLG